MNIDNKCFTSFNKVWIDWHGSTSDLLETFLIGRKSALTLASRLFLFWVVTKNSFCRNYMAWLLCAWCVWLQVPWNPTGRQGHLKAFYFYLNRTNVFFLPGQDFLCLISLLCVGIGLRRVCVRCKVTWERCNGTLSRLITGETEWSLHC